MTTRSVFAAILPLVLLSAQTADAVPRGWCQGVGNPHQSSACSGATNAPNAIPGVIPGATTRPSVPTGPTTAPPVLTAQPVLVTPTAPLTFTDYGPVQTITGTVGAPVVGYAPVQTVTGTIAPPVVGYGPVQTLTGTTGPTFVGYGPVPVLTGTPGPNPTVGGIAVTPIPPRVVTGSGPVPPTVLIHPVASPGFTGTGQVPPVAAGSGGPAQPTLIPRPRPLGQPTAPGTQGPTTGTITHDRTGGGASVAQAIVPHATGRQDPGGAVSQASSWTCLTGGHGPRLVETGSGPRVIGTYSHIGQVDALARDVPARHPTQPHCIVAIRRD
ncbi:hypothetical protein [Roseicyclus marinus]|uniref:hypothetical protein n=1 Tax=Roseicyclus marinus TaxID=2161673 RepID=UPI002410017E|nr:hypothetical protein [Roseicyclus marinus]MDG3043026.1 hypothetical protein [Roseicyclus marinus]